MGGIPTNYHGEVLDAQRRQSDTVVPGLLASARRFASPCTALIGWAPTRSPISWCSAAPPACAAARPSRPAPPCRRRRKDADELALSRLDKVRHAAGSTPTSALRLRMQKAMQSNCAVFRTGPVLEEGVQDDPRGLGSGNDDLRVSDRSLVWNSDLIEALEYENLIVQAATTVVGAATARRAAAPMRARTNPSATTSTG